MAKFKNTTGFNQVVVINGKKRLVRKDGVIELRDDFIQTGFEKVADDTPVTVRAKTNVVRDEELKAVIDNLNNRMKDLEDRINNNETISEMETKIQQVTEKALKLETGASKDLVELRDLTEKLNESVTNQAEFVRSLKENEQTVLKRLEILKTAMQAMEMQIDEITGFSEEVEGN